MATILILDEEADSCMLLKRLLERNAHQVWAFVTANDALECAATKSVDLALVSLASRHDTGSAVPAALEESQLPTQNHGHRRLCARGREPVHVGGRLSCEAC